MIPKSFSASAMQVAELCMSRYKAENIDRGRGIQHSAASLGTSVHGALEMFVKFCHIEMTQEPSLKLLLELYRMSYMTVFGTADTDTLEYNDGVTMLENWWHRNYVRIDYFSTVKVLSVEVKENFPIPTSIGAIPYNFIWDRADEINEVEWKVVDYKSQRWAPRTDELKKKIQVRAYGLAAAIKAKNAGIELKRIWVELDMLRHDGPIGVSITREDNIAAWLFFKEKAQQIVDTPDEDAPESLNPECRWCVRKVHCETLRKNVFVGGIMSLSNTQEAVDIRAALEYQIAAASSALKEIDDMILEEAKQNDKFEWTTDDNVIEITSGSRRAVDAERVERVLGDEMFRKYGSTSITLATIDKLLKGTELSAEQKIQLKSLIYTNRTAAKVTVKPKTPFDE